VGAGLDISSGQGRPALGKRARERVAGVKRKTPEDYRGLAC